MKLPKGTYAIIDPCYVFPDDEWSQILEDTGFFNLFESGSEGPYRPKEEQCGIFERKSMTYAVCATAHGDGSYYAIGADTDISVDAGLIGCIPIALCEKATIDEMHRLGAIVNFVKPVVVAFDGEIIQFGDIIIETGDVDDEEEMWDEDDIDEEW